LSRTTAALAELRSADSTRFGGKSAALGELIGAAIPVPGGFGISTAAYDAFLDDAGLRDELTRLLAGLDVDDVQAVTAVADTIGAAVLGAQVPAGVRAELAGRYEEIASESGEDAPPVAVRSSALGEDGAEATFAGQQETVLWVRGEDALCEAVLRCWASLHSPPAITYRARLGDAGRAPAMGVAVQRMVDAETAGVLFTCNPVSGDPSVVAIDASWGLGLGVVGGEVTPDEYLVSKVTGEVVRRTIGSKGVEYRPDPAGAGTVRVDVPADRAEAPCLDDEQLAALLAIAKDVERHFCSRQDVEWAIDRAGRLFVLQSRPVTAAPATHGPAGASALSLVMATFGVATPPERSG
jgi:pyruvate, water dikinase